MDRDNRAILATIPTGLLEPTPPGIRKLKMIINSAHGAGLLRLSFANQPDEDVSFAIRQAARTHVLMETGDALRYGASARQFFATAAHLS